MSLGFSLRGRTAFVTGSTEGIGKAIALAFAEAGAAVVLHGLEKGKKADAALNEARTFGRGIHLITGDLAIPGAGKQVAAAAAASAGTGIDILVLNASVQSRAAWNEITAEEAQRQMQANFHASLEIIQTLAEGMIARRWGRILTIGSVQQVKPHPQMPVYAASKAALSNLVLSLAKQFAPHGLTVNNLAPGVILTARNTEALADESYAAKMRSAIPAGFFGEASDCAGAALLLCSEAGRYITGQNLFVDGGMQL